MQAHPHPCRRPRESAPTEKRFLIGENQSLLEAWRAGQITEADALAVSNRPTDLDLQIRTETFEQSQSQAAFAGRV